MYCSLVPGLSKDIWDETTNLNYVYTSMLLAKFFILPVPPPTSVNVTSDRANPIRPIGSTVTLTCTVELSPAVDVPVTVTIVWTGPVQSNTTNTVQPVMGSNTTYISTTMVSSFGREQSGVYNCTASVSSTSLFLNNGTGQTSIIVTVGKVVICYP